MALAIFFSAITPLQAQDRCNTNLDLPWLQVNDPGAYQRFMDLENFTASYIASQNSTTARLIDPNGLIIIPVVVHVLHYGEQIGSGYNISMDQIESQITALNELFRRLNADRANTPARFASRAADLNIEFRLAHWAPDGNQTTGVVRKQTSESQFRSSDDAKIKAGTSGSIAWDPYRYLNIWVCNLVDVLGYSSLPHNFSVNAQFDGIVIRTTAFGTTGNVSSPYHMGKTAAHEVGHWLSLRHIWGDEYCGNDFVDDTPTQGNFTSGCPSDIRTSCNNGPDGDMYMNYMDITQDPCMNLFTNGQRLRTRALFATVNGTKGARADQMDGFFGFRSQPTSITCKGTIIVSPMDLPVTWTVSGPAIITSGNGSTKIELEATANGTVHLMASSGNYFAETDLSITYGTTPPTPTITAVKTSSSGEPTEYRFTATSFSGVNYEWYRAGVLQTDETTNVYDCYYPCNTTVEVYCKVVNSCGTTESNKDYKTGECIRTKETYTLSPNPASSTMTVSTVKASNRETKNGFTITEVKIYDQSGILKKQAKYGKVRIATLNISSLQSGVYLVEIICDDHIEKTQLLVQKQ